MNHVYKFLLTLPSNYGAVLQDNELLAKNHEFLHTRYLV